MDNFIQTTVFCLPEPRVDAFVYRNAGKVCWCVHNMKVKCDLLNPKKKGVAGRAKKKKKNFLVQEVSLHFLFHAGH